MELKLKNEFSELRSAFLSPEKYVCIVAGRRSGKTFEAFDWLYKELFLEGAKNALWVDTKHSNIDKYVDRYVKPRLKDVWKLCNYNQQKKVLVLPNNKYIDFGSAERAENLEGFQYDRMVINEAGIALKRSSLWDNTLRPMTKGFNTKVRIIGTPKGKNKFYNLYMLGKTESPEWKSFSFPAESSPYWDREELDKIKKEIPSEVWRQEYMAEFIEGGGQVFRGIENCIKDICYDVGKPKVEYVMGVDLAKHQDYTVITVAELNTKQVVYIERFNNMEWSLQKESIVNTWNKFKQPRMIIDSTGVGDAIFDDLVSKGIDVEGYKFTNQSKNQLIRKLIVSIQNASIFFYPDENLLNELQIFSYEVTASGNMTYNAPDGFHDDMVVSLALANWLLESYEPFTISFV